MIKQRIVNRSNIAPISLSRAKDHLRVDHDYEDTLIRAYLNAATEHAEHYCDRLFMRGRVQQFMDEFAGGDIELYYPIANLVAIQYYNSDNDLTNLDLSEIDKDTESISGIIKNNGDWPSTYSRINAITITYDTGISSNENGINDNIKSAILLILGKLYECREDSIHQLPTASQRLLEPFRRYRI